MAKDVSNKTHLGNNFGDTSPSLLDSQKVPPLRIVLNTAAGNQKTSPGNSTATTPTTHQESQSKATTKSKQQDSKQQPDSGSVKGGRFRIKLGTNKQQSNKTSNNPQSTEDSSTHDHEEKQKNLAGQAEFSTGTTSKEESSTSSSKTSNYLRRITRRSQRSVQVITNENEESISSMTSIDENQNNQISNSDSNPPQETSSTSNSASANGAAIANSITNSQGIETPRKYKKRRVETSENLTNEQLLFSIQNYSVPVQNSFKLFKNIRQQVDKKLDTLNTTLCPRAPRGFREYMLAKGAYLLEGNRLGNGANLTINENGGMNIETNTKFKSRRFNYYIPDRAKVPLNIPRDSPLRDLFVEQEKERYRMKMQHIKEREKLTIAAEQEIMRVYNQAAMASVNQIEPLSVCTMLKHQEIYNYMDSDGIPIQANEENSQDEVSQEGVRTRRRQHEQVSPPQVRKTSSAEENQPLNESKVNNETTYDTDSSYKPKEDAEKESVEKSEETIESNEKETKILPDKKRNASPSREIEDDSSNSRIEAKRLKTDPVVDSKTDTERGVTDALSDVADKSTKLEPAENQDKVSKNSIGPEADKSPRVNENRAEEENDMIKNNDGVKGRQSDTLNDKNEELKNTTDVPSEVRCIHDIVDDWSNQAQRQTEQKEKGDGEETPNTTHNDEQVSGSSHNSECKDEFVVQLQEVDDKWENIRAEMLIRHRNEAESLHAVQRLEWEWKTKEIGAIDVRSTLVINDVLVPKLAIYSQDY